MAEENINKWKLFKEFLLDRLKKPTSHPEFVIYFVLLPFAIGAVDIWASLYILNQSKPPFDYQHLQISIIGFSLILICSGGIDLIFSTEKYIKRIIQLSAIFLIILDVSVFFIFFKDVSYTSFTISIL